MNAPESCPALPACPPVQRQLVCVVSVRGEKPANFFRLLLIGAFRDDDGQDVAVWRQTGSQSVSECPILLLGVVDLIAADNAPLRIPWNAGQTKGIVGGGSLSCTLGGPLISKCCRQKVSAWGVIQGVMRGNSMQLSLCRGLVYY